jgi:hypothetical protein
MPDESLSSRRAEFRRRVSARITAVFWVSLMAALGHTTAPNGASIRQPSPRQWSKLWCLSHPEDLQNPLNPTISSAAPDRTAYKFPIMLPITHFANRIDRPASFLCRTVWGTVSRYQGNRVLQGWVLSSWNGRFLRGIAATEFRSGDDAFGA